MESDRNSEGATDDGKGPDKDEYFDGFGCSIDDAGSSAPRDGKRDDATRYMTHVALKHWYIMANAVIISPQQHSTQQRACATERKKETA